MSLSATDTSPDEFYKQFTDFYYYQTIHYYYGIICYRWNSYHTVRTLTGIHQHKKFVEMVRQPVRL